MQRRSIHQTFDARQAFWWYAGTLAVFFASRLMSPLVLFTARPADSPTRP
jgi:hypothetical protein